jgi:hypothetical protein
VPVSKLDWRMVPEARARPNVVAMPKPGREADGSFAARAEPLEAQAFIAELAIEALVRAVLPRVAWIDERCLEVALHYPLQGRVGYEFANSSASGNNCLLPALRRPRQPSSIRTRGNAGDLY